MKGFKRVFSLSTQRIHWQKCLKQRFLLIYDLSFLIWKEEGGEMILSNQKSIFVWHTIMSTYGKVHHLSFSYFYIFLKVIFCSFWKPQKGFFCVTVKFCNHIGNDANGWCSTGVPKHFTPLKEIILQPFIGLDMLLATEHHQSQNLIDFYRFLAWRFQTPCKNVINLAADDALKRWLVHRSGSSSWKQSSWTSNKVYSPTHPLLIWQQA